MKLISRLGKKNYKNWNSQDIFGGVLEESRRYTGYQCNSSSHFKTTPTSTVKRSRKFLKSERICTSLIRWLRQMEVKYFKTHSDRKLVDMSEENVGVENILEESKS